MKDNSPRTYKYLKLVRDTLTADSGLYSVLEDAGDAYNMVGTDYEAIDGGRPKLSSPLTDAEAVIAPRRQVVRNGVDISDRSGIIKTGARITNPEGPEAVKFAEMYYEEIRHFSTDVQRVADNLGKDVEDIKKVKKYLFEDDSLYEEDLGRWRRFYPDCAIAQSWQRLTIGKDIKPHDRLLIEHELYEMELKKNNPHMSHREAHDMATEKYNYQGESKKYYDSIKRNNQNR